MSKKGYDISVDMETKILTLRAWGLWDKNLAEQYLAEYKEKVAHISADGPPWYVLVDYREFPAQTRDVQEYVKQALKFAVGHKVTRQARVVPNMITSMQIKRLSSETGLPENAHFLSEEEAIDWLLNK